MKTICKIVNLMIFVSASIILFTEIYATFNCWTLDSSIINVNFTTILIVALTVRVGLIDFKIKDENDKKGVKFMLKKIFNFIWDTFITYVSLVGLNAIRLIDKRGKTNE